MKWEKKSAELLKIRFVEEQGLQSFSLTIHGSHVQGRPPQQMLDNLGEILALSIFLNH